MTFMPIDEPDSCGTGNAVAAGHKPRNLLELSVGYGLILLAIWTPQPWQSLISVAALALVLLATWASFDGWSAMGLSMTGFRRSFWLVGAALLLAAVSMTLADRLHTLHVPPHPAMFAEHFWGYILWAFLQEFLLLDFILLRLQRLLPGGKAAVIAAVGLFAVAHLPNPILTALTLLWGWIACRLFLQYRNLYTLAMAHAIFGICIAVTVPGSVNHGMRVGLGYHRQHKDPHSNQKDHTVSTHACVIADAPTRRS
jgi:hypothetical protein